MARDDARPTPGAASKLREILRAPVTKWPENLLSPHESTFRAPAGEPRD